MLIKYELYKFILVQGLTNEKEKREWCNSKQVCRTEELKTNQQKNCANE